jgi:hypothetical protein
MKTDPREMVGRLFDSLGYAPTAYVEEFRSDEGLEPDWAIELRDGSMQFLLTKQRTVATVFVLSKQLISEVMNVSAENATIRDVLSKHGSATTFGQETEVPPLGRKGAWLRYDDPQRVTHLEFNVGGIGVHMLTLMAPEHAP